jgi:hypothetical protein
MRDPSNHFALRDDLIAHLWLRKGQLDEEISKEDWALPPFGDSSDEEEEGSD